MNSTPRRILLAATAILGAYVGIWAAFFPGSFYDAFPGFGLAWVSVDGPFNEHLIRDVGGLYLGLTAASIAAILARTAAPGRVVGLGWAVFGAIHYGYHLLHLEGSAIDIVGNVVSLGISLALGVLLALPARPVVVTPVSAAPAALAAPAASVSEATR
ncbi:hypothetical protein N1027_09360 [Herbiconiux sp. CPCC 205763]|uniref:DUF4383 domain-containing protein n=1 Tax=Herbiconiux aconitum TaxID=2970913 RepID=A0ABT2GQ51_9MICO|nr:hypothetical protein [Herbiconiux aconitum]MCS5718346.1 hypothetical protein [Herbiconiux aconitum]